LRSARAERNEILQMSGRIRKTERFAGVLVRATIHPVPKGGTMTGERAIQAGTGLAGVVWFGGWLFTMAFAKLVWWQCIVGLVIWPYYMGLTVR
jgi:hypothetical protein